jgi:hypothetical protein
MMKRLIAFLGVALLAMACGVEEPDRGVISEEQTDGTVVSTVSALDISGEIARSRAAIQEFAGALQAELSRALKAGGPVKAIEICNTEAMLIAAEASMDQGLNLGRVSLKNRNPTNYPNDWQAAVLVDFEQRKEAGEDVEDLEWWDVVEAGERQEFRYMKAIPTRAFCLQCHGVERAPGVDEILAQLYPDDLGIGFREGDIRGAFVVRGVLD